MPDTCNESEENELLAGIVARALNDKYPVRWYGKFYVYQLPTQIGFRTEKGKAGYVAIDDRLLRKKLYDLSNKLLKKYGVDKPKEIKKGFINDILYHLENMGLIIETDIDLDLIYVNNGILDTKSGDLIGSMPDTFIPTRIPITYNKLYTTCPGIDSFFDAITREEGSTKENNGDNVTTLYEQFGVALDPEYTIRKGHLFSNNKGAIGHNGKTTLLNLLTDFLGEDNVSNISLYDFQDRFTLPELANKLANVRDDIGHDVLGGHGRALFKEFTGGAKKIMVRRIRQNPFYMRNRARFYYAANFLPSINLNDIPFIERWVVQILPNQFPDDDLLPKRLRRPEELSGLLNQACEAKINLRRQKKFTKSKTQGFSELIELFRNAKIPDVRIIDEDRDEFADMDKMDEDLNEMGEEDKDLDNME